MDVIGLCVATAFRNFTAKARNEFARFMSRLKAATHKHSARGIYRLD